MLESRVSRRTYRPCACPGCNRRVSPGELNYPYCSGRCRAKDGEQRAAEVSVKPVRQGELVSTEVRGGGVYRRPAVVEGILVQRGDDPAVFVPRVTVEAALAILDGSGREANGHGR